MWSKPQLYAAALCLCLMAASCKTKKNALTGAPGAHITSTTNNALANLLKNIEDNENAFEYYQCRSKLTYTSGEKKQELDATITMEKNKYVLFAFTAALGIQVARILATPDSVVVLDLLHRKATIAGYDYLSGLSQIPLSFAQLQNIIAGNAPYAHRLERVWADTVMSQIVLTQPVDEKQAQAVTYDPLTLKPAQAKIWERAGAKECKITYSMPVLHKQAAYPSKWQILISAEKTVQFEMEADNFVFEKKKELGFNIPKSFEVEHYQSLQEK